MSSSEPGKKPNKDDKDAVDDAHGPAIGLHTQSATAAMAMDGQDGGDGADAINPVSRSDLIRTAVHA